MFSGKTAELLPFGLVDCHVILSFLGVCGNGKVADQSLYTGYGTI